MKLPLPVQISIGMIFGVLVGSFLPELGLTLSPIGVVFIRLLKMIIVPLVLSSLVCGVVSLGDISHVRSLGLKTFIYFIGTTAVAGFIGIVMATLIKPGIGAGLGVSEITKSTLAPPPISQIIIDIVPQNMIKAMADGQILSVIFIALLLGCAMIVLGSAAKPLENVFRALDDTMMTLTQWIIKLTPFGVFSLMAKLVAESGLSAFLPLMYYIISVLSGLFIHAVIILPLLLVMLARVSPFHVAKQMFAALATALSTASSAATLPITMDRLQSKLNIPNKIVSFIIPLGTTMNMDGTALYQAAATVFIAQAYGIQLSLAQLGLVIFTTTLASIGAAAIPSAGLITLVIILNTVGVPVEGIGLIIAVDRVLDMFRTSVNVWTNITGTVILAKLEKNVTLP